MLLPPFAGGGGAAAAAATASGIKPAERQYCKACVATHAPFLLADGALAAGTGACVDFLARLTPEPAAGAVGERDALSQLRRAAAARLPRTSFRLRRRSRSGSRCLRTALSRFRSCDQERRGWRRAASEGHDCRGTAGRTFGRFRWRKRRSDRVRVGGRRGGSVFRHRRRCGGENNNTTGLARQGGRATNFTHVWACRAARVTAWARLRADAREYKARSASACRAHPADTSQCTPR